MSDRNRVIPTIQAVLGLILGIGTLVIGLLYLSVEHGVIATQRFTPDAIHNIALELKGRNFYVSATENDEYYHYKDFFLTTVGIIWVVFILKLLSGRYWRNRKTN